MPNFEITVANIGTAEDREILNRLTAMGVNKVIQLCCSNKLLNQLDCLGKAKLLRDLVTAQNFDLVTFGVQSSDGGSAQVGAALAGLLN